MNALNRAIKHMGSQAALARAIGWTPQAVSLWYQKKIRVPAEAATLIERATNKAVTRQQLRPDIFNEV